MACYREFLSDSFQAELRRIAQMQSDRHEDALNRYKKVFISEWILAKEQSSCSTCKHNKDDEELNNLLSKIELAELKKLFDDIANIYVDWINSDVYGAFEKLKTLMEENKMLDFPYNVKNLIMYRGRITQQILTPFDMFHIPFNRRYLIGNQRYSLTGQPLLYLGFSVYDILKELREDDMKKISISTYVMKEDFEVYDFRNDFYDYYRGNIGKVMIENYPSKGIEFDDLIRKLKKFILINMCSFKKRNTYRSYTFSEEYVLPQLVAQLLKKKDKRGILYSSTNVDENDYEIDYNIRYKDNVAIFTNLNNEHVYDRDLFSSFRVSNPVTNKDIFNVKFEDATRVADHIKLLDTKKEYQDFYNVVGKMKVSFEKLKIQEKPYMNTEVGKMNLFLTYLLLLEIRNNILGGESDE